MLITLARLLVTLLSLRRILGVVVKSLVPFFFARASPIRSKTPFEHKSTPNDANAQLDSKVGKEVAAEGPHPPFRQSRSWICGQLKKVLLHSYLSSSL